MSKRITIEGITYDACHEGTHNAHNGHEVVTLTRIGKRGKPVNQHRGCLFDGESYYRLTDWFRF